MAGARSHPATLVGLAVVAAVTTLISLLSWQGFTERYAGTLGPLFVVAVVVAGTGSLARWWRVPRPAIVALQLVLVGMVVSAYTCGSPLPVGDAWERMQVAFSDAVDSANQFAPPVPDEAAPVHPLLIAGGAACLLLVDVLACTLRRVPLAGLPLLTIYSVPVSMTGDGPHWLLFTLTAIGFLSMIFLSESEQIARWGPMLSEASESADPLAGASWPRTGARAIGGVATALAVVVPVIIPTFSVHLFDFGPGSGGDDEIRINNPMIDLRRDLRRGEDVPLLTVRTDDPDPSYLRIAVLNRFSSSEWSSGNREVPPSQVTDGAMPKLVGVSTQVPRTTYEYDLESTDALDSTWLPHTQMVERIEAPGDWRYDTATMDFLASEDGLDAKDMSWSLTAVELDYDANRLALAGPVGALVGRELIDLPDDLNPLVARMTRQVTALEDSKFEQAIALQQFFRETGGFEYSTDVELETSEDDLVDFLSPEGREGYCEQFAAAMAVMARTIGIPARVAVGFLQPDETAPGTWVYSAHDLHAWPELFFRDSGWVRFEPTPPTRANGVPSYTTDPISVGPDDTAPTATNSANEDDLANVPSGRPEDEEAAAAADDASAGSALPWGWIAAGVALTLVLAALALTPRLLRRRRRERRGLLGPEEAWAELRDTALDLRLPWPMNRSPWQTRERLVQLFGAPLDEYTPDRPRRGPDTNADAVLALDRIVHALERLRYARPDDTEPGTWRAEMQTCVEALYGGAPQRSRRAADWWPRSVFVRTPRVQSTFVDSPAEPAMAGRVVVRVG